MYKGSLEYNNGRVEDTDRFNETGTLAPVDLESINKLNEVSSYASTEDVAQGGKAKIERGFFGEFGAGIVRGGLQIAELAGKAGAFTLSGGLHRSIALSIYDKWNGVEGNVANVANEFLASDGESGLELADRGEMGNELAQKVLEDRLTMAGMGDAYEAMGENFQKSESVRNKSIFDEPKMLLDPTWWASGLGELVPSMIVPVGVGASSAYKGVQATRMGLGGFLKGSSAKGVQRVGHALTANSKMYGLTDEMATIVANRARAGGLAGGLLEGAGLTDEIYERGGTAGDALLGGVAFGTASAMLNTYALRGMLEPSAVTGLKSKAFNMMKSGLKESLTEALEEPTQATIGLLVDAINGADSVLYEEGIVPTITESLKAGVEVGLLSMVSGMAMHGGATPTRSKYEPDPIKYREAVEVSAIRDEISSEGGTERTFGQKYTDAPTLDLEGDLGTASVHELLKEFRTNPSDVIAVELSKRDIQGVDNTIADDGVLFDALKSFRPELANAKFRPAELSKETYALQEASKAVGMKAMFYEGDPKVQGVSAGSTILINVNAKDKMKNIMAHEWFHVMKAKNPELAGKLEQLIDAGGDTFQRYKERLDASRKAVNLPASTVELQIEETVADMFKDMSSTKEFWDLVNSTDGTMVNDMLDLAEESTAKLSEVEDFLRTRTDITKAMKYGASLVNRQLNLSEVEKALGIVGATEVFEGITTESEERGTFRYIDVDGVVKVEEPKGGDKRKQDSYVALKQSLQTQNADEARQAISGYLRARWKGVDSDQEVAYQKIASMLETATDEDVLLALKGQGSDDVKMSLDKGLTEAKVAPHSKAIANILEMAMDDYSKKKEINPPFVGTQELEDAISASILKAVNEDMAGVETLTYGVESAELWKNVLTSVMNDTFFKGSKVRGFTPQTFKNHIKKLVDRADSRDRTLSRKWGKAFDLELGLAKSLYEAKGSDDVKMSLDKVDAEYMSLAKDPEGNAEALQAMVDAQAKKAGYGEETYYHGSPSKGIKVFKGLTKWFTPNKKLAKEYAYDRSGGGDGALHSVKIAEGSTLTTRKAGQRKTAREFAVFMISQARDKGLVSTSDLQGNEKLKSLIDSLDRTDIKPLYEHWDSSEALIDVAETLGFRKIETFEDGAPTVGVINPEDIKSTDAITRDDKGNIIPLSERFNVASDDIRFSLEKADSKDKFTAKVHEFRPAIGHALNHLYDTYELSKNIEGVMKRIRDADTFLTKENPKSTEELTTLINGAVKNPKAKGVGKGTVPLIKIILENPDPSVMKIKLDEHLNEVADDHGKPRPKREGKTSAPILESFMDTKDKENIKRGLSQEEVIEFGPALEKVMSTAKPLAITPHLRERSVRNLKRIAKVHNNFFNGQGRMRETWNSLQTGFIALSSSRLMFDKLGEIAGDTSIGRMGREFKDATHKAHGDVRQRLDKIWGAGVKDSKNPIKQAQEWTKVQSMKDIVSYDVNVSRNFKLWISTDNDTVYGVIRDESGEILQALPATEVFDGETLSGDKVRDELLGGIVKHAKLQDNVFVKGAKIEVPTEADWKQVMSALDSELQGATAGNMRVASVMDFGVLFEIDGAEYLGLRKKIATAQPYTSAKMDQLTQMGKGTPAKVIEGIADGTSKDLQQDLIDADMTVAEAREYVALAEEIKAETKEFKGESKNDITRYEELRAKFEARQPSYNKVGEGKNGANVRGTVTFDEMAKMFNIYISQGEGSLREALKDSKWGTRKNYWMSQNERIRTEIKSAPKTGTDGSTAKGAGVQGVRGFGALNRRTGLTMNQEGDAWSTVQRHITKAQLQANGRYHGAKLLQAINQAENEFAFGLEEGYTAPKDLDDASEYYSKASSRALGGGLLKGDMRWQLSEMVNKGLGSPSDQHAGGWTQGIMKLNSLFWKTYPLALSRIAFYSGRNILYQGQVWGPIQSYFGVKDIASAELSRRKGDDQFSVDLIERVMRDDMDQKQAYFNDQTQGGDNIFTDTTKFDKYASETKRFGRMFGSAVSAWSGVALPWSDTRNRTTITNLGVRVTASNVRKYLAGSIDEGGLLKAIKFDTMNASQQESMIQLLDKAVQTERSGNVEHDLIGFSTFITQVARNANENVNHLYATSDRTLVEQNVNNRPYTGILNYPRATAERWIEAGVKPLVLGTTDVVDGLRKGKKREDLKMEFAEMRTGLEVLAKGVVGSGISSLVASYVLGDKPDYDDEERGYKSTYGFLSGLNYSIGSAGFTSGQFYLESGDALIKSMFSGEGMDTDELKRFANKVLWMAPILPDMANIMESIGNTSGVNNLEALMAMIALEYPMDSYIENRTLMQNALHGMFATQEYTDYRDNWDKVLDSMGLDWFIDE